MGHLGCMEDIEEHALGIALEAGRLIVEASKKRLAHGSMDSVEEKKNCMQTTGNDQR